MRRNQIFVAVILVVIAGCSAGTTSGPPSTSVTPEETGPHSATEQHATSSPTALPTSTTHTETIADSSTPNPPDNPWREEPIVIGIRGQGGSPVNYTENVVRAATYWQNINHSDLAYDPSFVVEPNSTNPHVLIRLTDEIGYCGGISDNGTVGCAPLLTSNESADRPEIVRIQRGLTSESTYRVIRHELGHVLGLEHGEGPDQIMNPTGIFHSRVVRVTLEFETTAVHKQRDSRRQVRYALNYYADGAEGFLSEEVSFAIIEERSNADVIVDVRETGGESTATNSDGRFVITLKGIETDNQGWHVGYWLGVYFGAQSVDDLPPAFDEPNADPRQQWWH